MENPTYIALSKLDAQQRTMDVIAGNIANANTAGFRAQRVLFSDFLVKQHQAGSGEDNLAFTQDRATYRDISEGALSYTGNSLDVALGGSGYFSVQTPNGQRLTRAGRFQLSSDGTICDASGNALLDAGGNPIKLAANESSVQIASDGTISGSTGQIGKIGVVDVADANQLVAEGGALLRSKTTPQPVAHAKIVQGAVEQSNVNAISELTRMMQTERTFQFVSQFVQSESDRQQNAIDKLTQQQS